MGCSWLLRESAAGGCCWWALLVHGADCGRAEQPPRIGKSADAGDDRQMQDPLKLRFFLAWSIPVAVGFAAWVSPVAAWAAMLGIQIAVALAERVPALQHSPPAATFAGLHRWVLRGHVLLQAALLALGLWVTTQAGQPIWAVVLLGLGIGGVAGGQGITFAHELGHSRRRADRVLGWLLMGSVCYAHFMVEHYRGHHVRAATFDDPASARRGESLWRFLPRTLLGSLRSAWRLEAARLQQQKLSWGSSALLWASASQVLWLVLLWALLGPLAVLFWLVQSAQAIFLLETINYVEHYGLQRREQNGKREAFGLRHAWNADHLLTNCMLINLQRHSDHHMHAWKPYAELQPLAGPQLPTGYAGCLFLALVPALWFRLMEPRLQSEAALATS